MEPEAENNKVTETQDTTTPSVKENARPSSDSDSARTRDTKYSVMDQNIAVGHLLPELTDIETEDIQVFHWRITDWKGLEARANSPEFQAGGYPWRILLFPRGNNQHESVSVYVEVSDPAKNGLPDDWHVCAQFSLALSNPNDPTNFYANHATHRFSSDEIDWGFTRFYELKSLARFNSTTNKGPFLVNNEAIISVFVRVVRDETGVLWHSFANYDSRKETGYVGIKNQGATCYMNSLLQSLYCTNSFRRAVYQIPTDNDKPTESVSLALQRCFYNIQYSDEPIGTTELTKSFGWDSLEAFRQHDVQEFNRVLQDRLEEKMKGTPADGAISKLFLGRMKSYIKCINVNYESSRVEDYYDIQLNVKGCKDVTESFKDYVTVETLEGENKYMAEGHGLQDAKKGVIFESFPPVLHLQLKRFEYDFMRDTMVKINDRHEFPEEINLDAFCEKKSNENEDGPYDYVLHGVLVHSGDLHGGHYFALIKPEKDGNWFRFDDDRVTRVTKKEVFEENFGDEPVGAANASPPFLNGIRNNSARLMKRFTNAYMLVYIRKSKLDEVLGPVTDDDIPDHLKRRVSEERAILEKRRKDREEMHLHVKVAVITDSVFANRQEFDLAAFDDKNLEASPEATIFKVSKNDKVPTLKQAIIEHYNLQTEKFRLWSLVPRKNKTVRVSHLLGSSEEKQYVEKLREIACGSANPAGLAKLYLELPDSYTGNKLPNIKSDTLMIFLKYFDIKQQIIFGMGRVYVKAGDKIGDIVPTLRERAGLPKDASLLLYEEVKPTMFEFMNLKGAFNLADMQNGDIICYQLALNDEEAKDIRTQVPFATVREYFTAVYNRVVVTFKPKADKRRPEVSLTIDRRSTYNTVAKELGKELEADPLKILFITANPITKQPKDPLPYTPRMTLEDMVPSTPLAAEYAQAISISSIPPPIIYYEILDVNLADLESKRSLKVNILYPTFRDETTVSVFVPRAGVADDIIQALRAKGKLDNKEASDSMMRVYEAVDGKITTILWPDQPISNLECKRGSVIYVEQIPEEEQTMDREGDRLVQVVSYHKTPSRLHGVPFLFVLKKGELFSRTKIRLQQRTGISNKEWQKVKFVILKSDSTDPEVVPIEQDDCCLITPGVVGADDCIGLDRVDKSSRSRSLGSMFEGIVIRG